MDQLDSPAAGLDEVKHGRGNESREDLRLSLIEGFEKIWIEMDLAAVVAIIDGGGNRGTTMGALIKDCFD
nr:uncharacterized protein LOC109154910 [Ipomoea trifida]